MKLYICENIHTAKWRKNIPNDKKLSLAFVKKCICDFLDEKERNIDIVISKNEYGKPYVESIYKILSKNKNNKEDENENAADKIKIDISIFFSLSHSENMMICAVACFNIGADCQKINIENVEKCKKIAKRFYTEPENKFLNSILSNDSDNDDNAGDMDYYAKEQEYINNFFRIWTKKEAYIKYTGKGLAEGLNTFSVTGKTRQKSYCGEVYFKRISLANLKKLKKISKSDKHKFNIYLCYNKENKNNWQIKYFN